MSNGSRLVAVVVVVVLAAIGLYYAFIYNPGTAGVPAKTPPVTPTNTPPAPPAGGLEASKSGVAGGEATSPQGGTPLPPEGAFAPSGGAAGANTPSGSGTSGQGTAAPGAGSPGTGATGSLGSTGSTGGTGTAVVPPPKGSPTPTGGSALKNPETTPTAPAGMEYTLQSGDTLEGLARRFLHDGSKWRAIADANPGLNPNALKVGQTIKIPGADKAASSGSTQNTSTGGGTSSGTTSTANTYTVQKGDTLIGIARKVYGSDSDWKRILEANAATLKGNAEAIQPGMKLTIPPKR